MTAADITRAIEAIWRIESARLVAGLARLVRDVALAEDLAQDALVSAVDQWPKQGVPDKPGAWLMAVAKRRAIDLFRRDKLSAQKHEELARSIETLREEPDPAAGLELADALTQEAALADHHLLAAVRGDLLEKLGRRREARAEFERAARLTHNARERTLMLGRADVIAATTSTR